jgi:hypothetical protein
MKKLQMITFIKKQDVFYAGVSFKGHTVKQVENIYRRIKKDENSKMSGKNKR